MPNVQIDGDKLNFQCDCKRVHTITKNDKDEFVIETDESGMELPKTTAWQKFLAKKKEGA